MLSRHERRAVSRFVGRVLSGLDAPVRRVILFGSKARGDYDERSDIDLLLLCATPADDRIDEVGLAAADHADTIEHTAGVTVEPWAVSIEDLERGRRTPMLVDALADGLTLWPPGRPPLRLPFTPDDARFCAGRLLEWVADGGPTVRAALAAGRLTDAAGRARDDITRLATAVLLLVGDTRHRRAGSLIAFEERFVATGEIDPAISPAVDWAMRAFPADGGRGCERPPVPPSAAASAESGFALASMMETAVVPWILGRMRELEGADEFAPASASVPAAVGRTHDRVSSRGAIPRSVLLPRIPGRRPRSGTTPYAVP